MTEDQERYGNSWERTVIGHEPIDKDIFARELSRYAWAAERIQPGMRVLEFGCSSGFGTRLLTGGIHYTGVDYSREIVTYAQEHFGRSWQHGTYAFEWSTIDRFLDEHEGERWDVVIAFEVLEHVRNGREVAQRLKRFAPCVLLSTPYREPVGFWGKHHVLHGLREKDFPQFAHTFMWMNGHIAKTPTNEIANLLMMEWREGQTYRDRQKVLACVPTKDRPESLMHCLHAIAFQTTPPDKVNIYDDGARPDFREHAIGRYVLPLLTRKGIEWEVVWTPGQGQHVAHQLANQSGYDLVWRLDDDCVPEPDVLERLLVHMTDDVGAVGGAVYEMGRQLPGGTGRIEHFFDEPNAQWAPDQGVKNVDWLYCSFLYRAGLVDYKHTMSPAAFHEETVFSHRLKRAGWRLIADTSIHTHHWKAPQGGTRSIDLAWAYAWDEGEFLKLMAEEWGIKVIHLGTGLGDNLAFRHLVPDLKRKYQHVVIGSCYPEVFEDDGIVIVPYTQVRDHVRENVYDWMAEHRWTGHMTDAYREMYSL